MTVYSAPPPGAVRVEPLDTLVLVYHRPAGATHLLAEPAPEILTALADGPVDADALYERLRQRFDLADADRPGIAARLDELVAAGLVAAA